MFWQCHRLRRSHTIRFKNKKATVLDLEFVLKKVKKSRISLAPAWER
jgi:hypothetical protein